MQITYYSGNSSVMGLEWCSDGHYIHTVQWSVCLSVGNSGCLHETDIIVCIKRSAGGRFRQRNSRESCERPRCGFAK